MRDNHRSSCKWLKSIAAAVVQLVLPRFLPTGSAFTTSVHVSNAALHMSSTASAQSSTTSGRRDGSSQPFWDKPQPGVPERFLQRIKEEPWRGVFEPCVDHPLTEIKVEGEVPQALEGTLFRNGKRPARAREEAFVRWGHKHVHPFELSRWLRVFMIGR